MLLRLRTKLAEVIDGIDLSHCAEGDVIELSDRDARLLIAEGWAERAESCAERSCEPKRVHRDVAADEGPRGWRRAQGRAPEHLFQLAAPHRLDDEPR